MKTGDRKMSELIYSANVILIILQANMILVHLASPGQNNKSQLKKDYPKISALIQIIDSENMENLWKVRIDTF
jgi:hypothetical protein